MENYDIAIIGGGPAGYIAAIKASQLGFKTVCVEKRKTLGGTCLNEGCIPSKALLDSSEKFTEASNVFPMHGIISKKIELDLNVMLNRKNEVVDNLCKGIDGLFKKNKVTRLFGVGKIEKDNVINVQGVDADTKISAKHIIIATGSESINLPDIAVDEKYIVSSTGALSLSEVPKSMVVIGGGYIGLEMGSVWSRLGADVTVVEFLDKIVPAMDGEIGKLLHKTLEKQSLKFLLSTKVTEAKVNKDMVELKLESADGKVTKISTDILLVSVGRRPYTQGLCAEELGLEVDKRGCIVVDDHYRTNLPNIYAVGDVIKGPMLAHKAEEEAVAVIELIAGQAGHVNYNAIPAVIYTHPEVASVGKTEEELKQSSVEYKIGKFPFIANSRARAMGDTEGLVKVLACAKTDKVLGVHIIGPDAGTLIAEAVSVMEFGGAAEDIARTCHAHPTLNEALREAALAVDGKALNY